MFQLMIIIFVVSICELQARAFGYSGLLAPNRYYSDNWRDVNGAIATAPTGPESATSGGARILFTDAPVTDQGNAGSELQTFRISGGRKMHDGFDGTTTPWDDKSPFSRPYGLQLSTVRNRDMKSTINWNYGYSGGPVLDRGFHRGCSDALSAAAKDLQRNGGPTRAAVMSAANTDTAAALRKPEKRHWLKKLSHASAFPATGGMKSPSVSRGTVVPKRLHMTRATNGLRRLSTKRGALVKGSRKFGTLNASPVTKSLDGERLSTVTPATWVSVHRPVVGHNTRAPFRKPQVVPWHPYFFLSLIDLA